MIKANPLFLTLLLAIAVALWGCSAPAPERVEFDFPLPQGFSLTDLTDTSCAITDGETAVGGILYTGLRVKSIDRLSEKAYLKYIASIDPYAEFLAMRGEHYLSISMTMTDSQTQHKRSQQHYLFVQDGLCYDLWLDRDVLDPEESSLFLEAIRES